MKTLSEQTGFTLIEAMVAMAVLSMGILALYTMQVSAIYGNSTASQITRAATDGTNNLENIFVMDYDDDIQDLDGDGTNQDISPNDGVDDDGGNFGLQDTQCCPDGNDPFGNPVAGCVAPATADGCAQGQDGYAVYWNVAVDEPISDTKRVVVSVVRTDRGVSKNVEFEYIVALVVQQ